MKKLVYLVLVIAFIGLAINLFTNRASQDKDLAQKINALIENGETQINLTEITDFSWTQVRAFGPYTPDRAIEDLMGIKFKGDNGGIDTRDDRYLLIFADEKYAVKTVVLSRKHGAYGIKDNKILSVEQ